MTARKDGILNHIVDINKIIIMSKQTAVEWLIEQILKEKGLVDLDIKQAKEMEKEQIKEAYMSALPYGLEYSHYDKYANKYYNEIYKKEDK
jgi:hypothetical protein